MRAHALKHLGGMLETWLEGLSVEEFQSKYFHRSPLAQPGGAGNTAAMLDWSILAELAATDALRRMLVVRDGRLHEGPPPRSIAELTRLFADGYSVVFRECESHHPRMRMLADRFRAGTCGDVALQIYATPRGFHSFGWHYDCEDVFIVQSRGVKEYHLRLNTVNPEPNLCSMPRDMHYELETSKVMVATTLVPGDWLYIPRGWWHTARSTENSLSVSVGLLTPEAGGSGTRNGAPRATSGP